MKVKRQNHTVVFRGLVLVVAFALAILCMPFNGLVALAQMSQYTDYSYMTIGKVDEEVSTSVVKGSTYYIPNAYIGGSNNFIVGKTQDGELESNVTLQSSKVTVRYSSLDLTEINSSEVTSGETDITNKVVVTTDENNYGYFVASKVGTYTVTYSYTYKDSSTGKEYTNSYELKVDSEISSATISFDSNEQNFIPSIIDLALAKDGDSYKNLNLPLPSITDEDGEEVEDVNYVTSKDAVGEEGSYVLISVTGGVNSQNVTVSGEAGNYYIDGSVFADTQFGAGKYTVKYAYYLDGQFVTSTTKSTQVYSEENKYYTDYKLQLELASDWSDNGQTGVESTLPAATGVTSKDSKPASEKVDVYYTVKAYYSSTSSSKGYELISAEEYNQDLNGNEEIDEDEKVVNEDGTLVNPSAFKPLKDGWYTFEYTITDFYGNTVSSTKGVYEFENIKDEKKPTPIVYDASVKDEDKKHEDASYKLQSRAIPNSVVVYAIGIDDNVSKAGDEGVVLTRKIMTDDTVAKLTITDYAEYNLVFNYRNTTSNKAYTNLLTNNYLIRKQAGEISSDVEMLNWLKDNGYLIVVDNANYKTIYEIFNAENYFEGKTVNESAIDSADKALEWFKSAEAVTAGFAYIDVNETFGATSTENGMGSGQYYIHYIAKDAAGNETDITKSMYVGSYEDNDVPTIKFGTTLADSYLPNAKVTFDVPTATDNYDTNMLVKTMYRYLDSEGNVIQVNGKDSNVLSNNDLDELWADIANVRVDGKLLTETYAKYHNSTSEANDGYIDLTDASASSYSIDLSEAGDKAVTLQIVSYTYDDKGNANIYGETINISNTVDNAPPQFKEGDINTADGSFVSEYEQGQEIELPTMTVLDDAVSFMSFEVNVYYINGDTQTKVATYDYSSERDILSQSGAGKYTVHAGKFVASFAGEYRASIAVKDSNNKTVVAFVNYDVKDRSIIQPPVISTSLESKTVELDGDTNYDPETGIEIPTPSVSYQIPNSVTYDVYAGNEGAYANVDAVVMGVNENGKATNWSTTYGQQNSFKPNAVGEYPIAYTVNLTVYNPKTFTYQEMAWDAGSNSYKGGFFNYQNPTNSNKAEVVLNKDGSYVVNETGTKYTVVKDEDGSVKVYNYDDNSTTIDDFYGTVFEDVDLEEWCNDLVNYNLTSDVYTIIVQDTVGPEITEYDYVDTISTEDISATDGYNLKIYGIEATDKSGINADKSKIVLSWKLANGDTGSQTFNKQMEDTSYTIKSSTGNVLDGTYTITYTVYDNNNNYTTKAYTIAVGDNVEPTLTFADDFVKDSYEIGSELTIDPSKITFTDNKAFPEGTKPTISLLNTSTSKEVEYKLVGGMYVFDLDKIGTYTLTVEVSDAVENTATETFSIEVTARTTDTVAVYKIIGTILIVISVLVLVGVIVYFIVSKVKLDKELKK